MIMTKKKEGKFEAHTFFVKEKGRKGRVKGKNDGSGTKKGEKIVRKDRRKPLRNKGSEKEGKKSKKISKKVLTKKTGAWYYVQARLRATNLENDTE